MKLPNVSLPKYFSGMTAAKRYASTFQMIADMLNEADIPALLAGGFAVNAHKYSRMTQDIDFVIKENDFSKLEPVVPQYGYTPVTRTNIFIRYQSESSNDKIIDFLFIDAASFEKMLDDSQSISIAGKAFKVVSLKHLIAMKLHAARDTAGKRGQRDFIDICQLVSANDIDIEAGEFRDWCLKYGNADLYKRIRSACKGGV
ncbi:MAG: hypothetical protein GF398_16810 [Chitinivibrionales bacterium]|nr:hypothetical protein [Chitinivibrionales bacterium]